VQQLQKAKGAVIFSVEETGGVFLIAAATKKNKIQLYMWDHDAGEFMEGIEFPTLDIPKCCIWAGQRSLLLGYRKNYAILNTDTGDVKDLFPTGKGGVPLAVALPSQELLLAKDNIGIFIGFDGKPTRSYGLSWSEPPVGLGFYYPYVIALLPRAVEVWLVMTQALVQTVPISCTHVVATPHSAFVGSATAITRLVPVPLLTQVDELVARKDYSDALTLCQSVPDADEAEKAARLREIRQLYGVSLFPAQAEKAMAQFLEARTDPRGVIALIPELLSRAHRSKIKAVGPARDLTSPAVAAQVLPAMIAYLRKVRSQPQAEQYFILTQPQVGQQQWSDVLQVVDTSLLRTYLLANDDFVSEFIQADNACQPEEAEQVLQQHRKFPELVLFYRSKGLHRKALDVLAGLAKGPDDAPLHGPDATVHYLHGLGAENIDLVLHFSKWLLEAHPQAGLRVFTAAPHPFDPRTVLEHLKRCAPALCGAYLEYVVLEQGERDAFFHNEFIILILDRLKELLKDKARAEVPGLAAVPAGREPGELGQLRAKLLAFLKDSKSYSPEVMLSRFPTDSLYDERAIFLCRLELHSKALEIYVRRLGEHAKAEQYCRQHYDPTSDKTKDVFLQLVKVYLKPTDADQPVMTEQALEIMSRHISKIDAVKALALLPVDTSLSLLVPFFSAEIQHSLALRRNNEVIRALCKSENLRIKEQLQHARSRSITVTADTMCSRCSKRIGQSVFCVLPGQGKPRAIHFKCANQKEQNSSSLN
jgi:hypothetical protein